MAMEDAEAMEAMLRLRIVDVTASQQEASDVLLGMQQDQEEVDVIEVEESFLDQMSEVGPLDQMTDDEVTRKQYRDGIKARAEMDKEAKCLPERFSTEWTTAMKHFKSRVAYNRVVDDFALYLDEQQFDESTLMEKKVALYMDAVYAQLNWKGEIRNVGTSMRSKFSMLEKFWKFVYLKKLKDLRPDVLDKIGQWEKVQPPVTKAGVFSQPELKTIYKIPRTEWAMLPFVVYAVIAVSFAARGVEIHSFEWTKIRKDESTDGKYRYVVKFFRAKRIGVPIEEEVWITGKTEVGIIDAYVNQFPADKRVGKFFQKLLTSGKPGQNIGHNTMAKIGTTLALRIGIAPEEAKRYTGHWCRRNALTIAADKGKNTREMMNMSGHQNAKVCESYVAMSEPTRLAQGACLSMDSPERPAKRPRQNSPGFFEVEPKAAVAVPGQGQVVYNFTGCNFGDTQALSLLFGKN